MDVIEYFPVQISDIVDSVRVISARDKCVQYVLADTRCLHNTVPYQ